VICAHPAVNSQVLLAISMEKVFAGNIQRHKSKTLLDKQMGERFSLNEHGMQAAYRAAEFNYE
jgi:hypothetical protein